MKNVLSINLAEAKLRLFGDKEPRGRAASVLLGSQNTSVVYHSPLSSALPPSVFGNKGLSLACSQLTRERWMPTWPGVPQRPPFYPF